MFFYRNSHFVVEEDGGNHIAWSWEANFLKRWSALLGFSQLKKSGGRMFHSRIVLGKKLFWWWDVRERGTIFLFLVTVSGRRSMTGSGATPLTARNSSANDETFQRSCRDCSWHWRRAVSLMLSQAMRRIARCCTLCRSRRSVWGPPHQIGDRYSILARTAPL